MKLKLSFDDLTVEAITGLQEAIEVLSEVLAAQQTARITEEPAIQPPPDPYESLGKEGTFEILPWIWEAQNGFVFGEDIPQTEPVVIESIQIYGECLTFELWLRKGKAGDYSRYLVVRPLPGKPKAGAPNSYRLNVPLIVRGAMMKVTLSNAHPSTYAVIEGKQCRFVETDAGTATLL